MPTLQYNIETLPQFLQDAKDILIKNWQEIAEDQNEILLKPDFEKYVVLEKIGKLLIATVRSEGKLVGYCVMVRDKLLHYSDVVGASNDVIYLDPEYRGNGAGINLIKFVEEQFKGCLVVWHVKKAHPALGHVLQSLGYYESEILYRKKV